MRIAVVIAADLYIRSFVTTGALDELAAEHELAWLAGPGLTQVDEIRSRPGFAGILTADERRQRVYDWIRPILMMVNRSRSSSMAIKIGSMARSDWIKTWVQALPGVRQLLIRRRLRGIGPNREVREALERLRPDLVIAPTAGTDALVSDVIREAAALDVPSLALINGWDNVSSKMTFATPPDFMGVWGDQSVDQAVRIHGLSRDHVAALGVPTFERYFSFDPEQTASPYPWRYVLFAGCAIAFDERTALRALDDALTAQGEEDVKIVYRPHPWRHVRKTDDMVREEDFRHVVIDRQVRAQYHAAAGRDEPVGPDEFLPSLDYYPALVGHAEFVVCPLSTMVVESAILERRVLVLTYDDLVHDLPPNVIARFAHFQGIEDIDGFQTVDRLEALGPSFVAMFERPAGRSLREQIKPWLFHDERSYGTRLRALVRRIAP